MALLAVVPSAVSCQTSRAGQGSTSDTLVDPSEVPDAMRPEWEALIQAQAADPQSEAVDSAADALLSEQPPPQLRATALEAKAERQYLLGNDDEAIALCEEGLALLEELEAPGSRKAERRLVGALHRTLALALTRGGDPDRALAELTQLESWGSIERLELRGARAVALDRKGDTAGALAAFAAWRELLTDDAPAAGYAQERIRALVGHLDRDTIEALAEAADGPLAADCLRATLGVDPGAGPGWVRGCRPLPARIGILLPRSGKLAVLADAQFAAAVAAVSVLGRDRPVSFLWRDSGSTAATTREGADRLVADGAEVIVGPVGASNVRAAVAAIGDDRFLLPGEGSSAARGIAPTLEQRITALVSHARSRGANKVIVLTPDSSYGRRVEKTENLADDKHSKYLEFITYPSGTTSFNLVLEPVLGALRSGAALIIADALPRTELVARQLRRSQLRIAGGSVDTEGDEVLVMAMGEGLSPGAIDASHESLDGIWLAPVAHPDASSRNFEDEYLAQQGQAPNDQALLVWRALEAAWSGAASTLHAHATLVQIQGGRLVAPQTP